MSGKLAPARGNSVIVSKKHGGGWFASVVYVLAKMDEDTYRAVLTNGTEHFNAIIKRRGVHWVTPERPDDGG